jgi:hypothetical protein
LYLIVVGLAVDEDLADVVDRPLYLVNMPGLFPFNYQGGADDLGGCCDIQEKGLTRTDGFEMSVLRSSSNYCVSSRQQKELNFFNNLYSGSPCSPVGTQNG